MVEIMEEAEGMSPMTDCGGRGRVSRVVFWREDGLTDAVAGAGLDLEAVSESFAGAEVDEVCGVSVGT